MPIAADISRALGGRKSGDGWVARCPAHDDRNPSLSIHDRGGRVLVHCFAGCLRNWRVEDVREGRVYPKPGRGGLVWRKFGTAVRYLITDDLLTPPVEARDDRA